MSQSAEQLLFILLTVLPITLGFAVMAAAIIQICGMWRLLSSLGERGWKALVPLYSTFCLGRAAGAPLAPCISAVAFNAAVAAIQYFVNLAILGGAAIEPWTVAAMAAVSIGWLASLLVVNASVAGSAGRGGFYALGLTLLPVVFYWPCAVRVAAMREREGADRRDGLPGCGWTPPDDAVHCQAP